ncbi:MAG: hypothetical protein EXQ99_05305 [Alphaproteobacteria bacterium]|nr:hypothetical protein [Alphaproteobacteria bacterium]
MQWWNANGLTAATYGAVLDAASTAQRSLMYFPDGVTPEPDRHLLLDIEPVTLETADGLHLLAWYQKPRRTDAPDPGLFPWQCQTWACAPSGSRPISRPAMVGC